MCLSQTHRVAGVVIELLHDAVVRVSLDCSVAFITYQQVHIIDLQIRKYLEYSLHPVTSNSGKQGGAVNKA